mmetsp:Transcript_33495/g.61535  ORF Transcript_33495/g.61535 Transcript_33495/m.61535 type:complete len:125 (+) Transcript_33495:795-1169(+)
MLAPMTDDAMDFSSFDDDDDDDGDGDHGDHDEVVVISSFSENNAVATVSALPLLSVLPEKYCRCRPPCFDRRVGAWKACESGMEAAAAARMGRKDLMTHGRSYLGIVCTCESSRGSEGRVPVEK